MLEILIKRNSIYFWSTFPPFFAEAYYMSNMANVYAWKVSKFEEKPHNWKIWCRQKIIYGSIFIGKTNRIQGEVFFDYEINYLKGFSWNGLPNILVDGWLWKNQERKQKCDMLYCHHKGWFLKDFSEIFQNAIHVLIIVNMRL